MANKVWMEGLLASLPRYFNTLPGTCSIVLASSVVECSKAVLSAQSRVLEEHFMRDQRDVNELIARRRRRFIEGDDDDDETDDDDDDGSSVLVLSEYGVDQEEVVRDFFASFYTGHITLTPDTLHTTLKLSCQYEVSWVVAECLEFLKTFLNPGNILENYRFLTLLDQPDITSLLHSTLSSLDYISNYPAIASITSRLTLPLFTPLLQHLSFPSEEHGLFLALHWISVQEGSRKHQLVSLVSQLRLVYLSEQAADFLREWGESRGVATVQLYKYLLAVLTYRPERRPPRFPELAVSRSSYRRREVRTFAIPREVLANPGQAHELVQWEEGGGFRFRFGERTEFVWCMEAKSLAGIWQRMEDGGQVSELVEDLSDKLAGVQSKNVKFCRLLFINDDSG